MNKKKAEKIKNRNRSMSWFLRIVLIGYAFFFTSYLWLPDYGKLVAATPYYQKVIYGEYTFYLTQFIYSERDGVLQAIIEKENKGVTDGALTYSAVERKKGDVDVEVVKEETNYVILRMHGQEGWKEISLRIQGKGEETPAKLYTNIEEIKKVKSIPKRSGSGYQKERLLAQIMYDDAQVAEKEKQIHSLQKENKDIENRIASLEKELYPTEEEAHRAEELIDKAKQKKHSNETMISDLEEEIAQLEKRTEQIREQMKKGEEET